MSTTRTRAEEFSALHVPGDPFILYNVWDAGTARAVERAGAKAIATGSASVAEANGFTDGEEVPLEFAISNAGRIVNAVSLPVTVDFEGGYASDPASLERNAASLVATGAIGCNFEDQMVGTKQLYSIEEQTRRIAALRQAAGPDFFINARTDLFMKSPMEAHDLAMVEHALERANEYAMAGADGFFVPLLGDLKLLEVLCRGAPLPINFMTYPGCQSNTAVAEAGVARISYGPFPHRELMRTFEDAARESLRLRTVTAIA